MPCKIQDFTLGEVTEDEEGSVQNLSRLIMSSTRTLAKWILMMKGTLYPLETKTKGRKQVILWLFFLNFPSYFLMSVEVLSDHTLYFHSSKQ